MNTAHILHRYIGKHGHENTWLNTVFVLLTKHLSELPDQTTRYVKSSN